MAIQRKSIIVLLSIMMILGRGDSCHHSMTLSAVPSWELSTIVPNRVYHAALDQSANNRHEKDSSTNTVTCQRRVKDNKRSSSDDDDSWLSRTHQKRIQVKTNELVRKQAKAAPYDQLTLSSGDDSVIKTSCRCHHHHDHVVHRRNNDLLGLHSQRNLGRNLDLNAPWIDVMIQMKETQKMKKKNSKSTNKRMSFRPFFRGS